MRDRRVRRDDQVEAHHRGSGVDECVRTAVEIAEGLDPQVRQLFQAVIFLQADQADSGQAGQGGEFRQRDGSVPVVGISRAALPGDADFESVLADACLPARNQLVLGREIRDLVRYRRKIGIEPVRQAQQGTLEIVNGRVVYCVVTAIPAVGRCNRRIKFAGARKVTVAPRSSNSGR
jgi:hypothetical protein